MIKPKHFPKVFNNFEIIMLLIGFDVNMIIYNYVHLKYLQLYKNKENYGHT
jgi:hypothetical protein